MASITEQRIRKAASELVDYRWGNSDSGTASIAGKDMRDWQVGGSRVERAARSAVQKTKQSAKGSERSQPQKATATTRNPDNLASTALSKSQTSEMQKLEKEYKDAAKQWRQVDEERTKTIQAIKKAEAAGDMAQVEQLQARRKELGALSNQFESKAHRLGKEFRRLQQQINGDG